MLVPWVHDLESLEAINQDDEIRQVVLRMASLARDEAFLLAAEDYLSRCRLYH